MNVIVPLRLGPRAENTFVNLTVTVQLLPGCSVAPVQLSGPANAPTLKKYVRALPPDTATLLTVMKAPPAAAVFVSVTTCVPVTWPDGNVIVSGLGAIDTVARAATTLPESGTGEPTTGTFAAIVTDPAAAPTAVAVTGASTTLIVHEAPAVSVVPQVPPAEPVGRENGAVTVTVIPVADAAVEFVTVSACDGLVVPRAHVPNDSDAGATRTAGGITISTAPMSKPDPCGRDVPKKSAAGAPAANALLIAGEVVSGR